MIARQVVIKTVLGEVAEVLTPAEFRQYAAAVQARMGDGGPAVAWVKAMIAEAEERQSMSILAAIDRGVAQIEEMASTVV